MLEYSEKEKIEQYIDKIISGLWRDAKKNIDAGMSNREVIEKVINAAVNKFTPESKMVLSSVYNMLMEGTLTSPLFADAKNKAAFYEMDILKDINSKFDFDIPSKIDYEESKAKVNQWVAAGAIITTGGIVSISLSSWLPIGIAVVIAGIMAILINKNEQKNNQDVSELIREYYDNIKKSLLAWIEAIEEYYDSKVKALYERLGE